MILRPLILLSYLLSVAVVPGYVEQTAAAPQRVLRMSSMAAIEAFLVLASLHSRS